MASELALHTTAETVERPAIRHIGLADLRAALDEGWDDFRANPTHLFVLGLIYPIVGLFFGRLASGGDALPLIYPIVAGFGLMGPIAAVGLYEMSRRRERGEAVSLRSAFAIFTSPRLGAILLLGAILTAIFIVWLLAALLIYRTSMPEDVAGNIPDFVRAVLTTDAGHRLIVIGTAAGFVLALATLILGAFSAPLLVDRALGSGPAEQVALAIETSARAFAANLVPMAVWGLIVAAGLVLGSITLLVGFAIITPVMGHATWHLYRKVVGP